MNKRIKSHEDSGRTEKVARVLTEALVSVEKKPVISYSDLFKFLAFSAPFVISFTLWTISLDKRLAIVEQKQEVILEIRQDISDIKKDVGELKLKIARIEAKQAF